MELKVTFPGDVASVVPLKDDAELFKTILDSMHHTFVTKNADYGKSIDITYLLLGDEASVIRLWDKVLRLTKLLKNGKELPKVKDESIDDTLLDLATYSALLYMVRTKYKMCPDKLAKLGDVMKEVYGK